MQTQSLEGQSGLIQHNPRNKVSMNRLAAQCWLHHGVFVTSWKPGVGDQAHEGVASVFGRAQAPAVGADKSGDNGRACKAIS